MAYKPEQIEHWNDCGKSKSRRYMKKVTNRVNRQMMKKDLRVNEEDNVQIKYKRFTRGWEL